MRKFHLCLLFIFTAAISFSQNPQMLKDVYPGSTGSGIQQIVKTSNYSFFNAEDDDADPDRGLYRTDGTAGGTVKLNLASGVAPNGFISTKAEKLTALGDKIIFAGDNFGFYGEIWVSDGTQAGTMGLERFQPNSVPRGPVYELAAMNGFVYYGVVATNNKTQIRRTDGTAAGTSMVYEFTSLNAPEPALFKVINNVLYFDIYDRNGSGNDMVWRTDGTTAGTYMLKDMGTDYYLQGFFMEPVNGNICFMTGKISNNNSVLFKTDGTAAGTVPVYELQGGANNNLYPAYVLMGNTLYFTAFDAANGKELWKTDGTTAGTMLAADLVPGAGSSTPLNLTVLNNQLYFSGRLDGTYKFYKLNGSSATLVKDVLPLNGINGISAFAVSNNNIVFNASTPANGTELWVSDGTTANTVQVPDINPGAANAAPSLITGGNPVLFTANNGVNGQEIFKYNNNGDLLSGSHRWYVNDNSTAGDVYTGAAGSDANNGSKAFPFATINYAISMAQPDDSIIVDAGVYAERIIVNKSLYFKGAYSGVNPGNSLNRGASETILIPSAENNLLEIVTVQSPNVTFDGFLLDGDNPAITGSMVLNGVDVNAGMGIFNGNLQTDNLSVKNNIFKNFFRYGVFVQKSGAPVVNGINITRNHFDNIPSRTPRDGRAVSFFNKGYGAITNNTMTRVNTGVLIANMDLGSTDSLLIESNIIEAYTAGISVNSSNALTSSIRINNNQVSVADLSTWSAPGSTTVNSVNGIAFGNVTSSKIITLNNNTITGTRNGLNLFSVGTPEGLFVNGGTISNTLGVGVFYVGLDPVTAKLTLNNTALLNNDVGIDVSATDNTDMPVEFNNVSVTGGAIGLRVYGARVKLPGNTLTGISFSGQSNSYIMLTYFAFDGLAIDATSVSFDSLTGANMTLAQRFAAENKIVHRVDYNGGGLIRIKAGELYVTTSSFVGNLPPSWGTPTTSPDITRATNAAATGDIIRVDQGNYPTADFTLSTAVTIAGPNDLINPNDNSNPLLPNASRNPEAVISGASITIGTSGIAFRGLTFDAGNKAAIVLTNTAATNNDFGNFNFTNNIIRVSNTTNALNAVNITGKFVSSPNLPQTSGYTISDNRFEKSGSATGNSLNFNYVKNIAVTGNTFLVTGATLKTQQALSIGTVGITDAVSFTTNTVDQASTVVGGNRIAGALIASNKIRNTPTAFSNTNSMPESSSIEFSNNDVANDVGTPFILYNRTGTGVSNVLKIENNQFAGVSVAGLNQLFATMNLTFANSAQNPSFIIRGNKINYTGDFSAVETQFFRPVTVRGNIASVMLENNEVTVNNSGGLAGINPTILLPANPAISIITDNGPTGSMPANAVINVLNNKIVGYRQSVVVYDVFNHAANPYTGYGNIPAGAIINIHNNSFTGDSVSINNSGVGQPVIANCNWYGSAAAQDVIQKISTPSKVVYAPWLSNGTDIDPATGFQPVAGSCNGTAVTAVLTQVTNVTCNGANNGTINVTINNGSAPYTFAWSKDNVPGYSSLEDLNNLAPAVYQLKVTDANGSVDSVTATITEPAVLTASASGSNVSCFGGSNGSATVIAAGGTEPYSYLWSNAATTASLSSLPAGTYSVTVTDANGCTATASYTVTQPTALVVTMSGTNASCNGSATATPAGGTTPYTYLWSNGATTASIINVPPGTYTVTITDAHGCTVPGSFTITGNSPMNPSTALVQVSCFGGSNGSITVTGSGGTAPHTYNINGGAFQPGNIFSGLTAGTYVVGVKDANGCSDFVTRTITEPALLTVVQDSIRIPCFGVNNGRIYITAAGGSGARTYNWTGPNGYASTTQDPNNLFTGTYNLVVTDAKGCTASLSVVLTQRPQVSISETVIHIGCRGEFTGAINTTISGGSGLGFTYGWTGPNGFTATTKDVSGLKAGNYTINVTDIDNGCVVSKLIVVNQPAANLGLTTAKTNATGCNSLGTITGTGSGGTAPYQFSINGTTYQPSGSFSGLYAGTYTVWIKDANGCTLSKSLSITDNGADEYEGNNSKNQAKLIAVSAMINGRIALAADAADWFKFTTPAGTANYILSFNHPSASFLFNMYAAGNNTPALVPVNTTSTTKEYVLSGNTTYYVSITGGLSYVCYAMSVSPTLMNRAGEGSNTDKEPVKKPVDPAPEQLNTTVYPNPHQGSFTLVIDSPEEGLAKIELFSITGQKLAERTVQVRAGKNNVPFSGMRQGTILYKVQVGKYNKNGKVIGIE